jgi:hypothetical protein
MLRHGSNSGKQRTKTRGPVCGTRTSGSIRSDRRTDTHSFATEFGNDEFARQVGLELRRLLQPGAPPNRCARGASKQAQSVPVDMSRAIQSGLVAGSMDQYVCVRCGDPTGNLDSDGLFLTCVDAACLHDPMFCTLGAIDDRERSTYGTPAIAPIGRTLSSGPIASHENGYLQQGKELTLHRSRDEFRRRVRSNRLIQGEATSRRRGTHSNVEVPPKVPPRQVDKVSRVNIKTDSAGLHTLQLKQQVTREGLKNGVAARARMVRVP